MDEASLHAPARRRPGPGRIAAAAAAATFLVVLLGGYGGDWRWTGFQRSATLWDWLELVLLPLSVVVAPLWLRHRGGLGRTRHLLLTALVAAFVVLVVLGYTLDLHWTGFPGNRLWDWLELLALPLAVALLPVWSELSLDVGSRHVVAAACALAALAVAAVGGYAYDWRWTGFQGNTLFDWLKLLIAPLLLPVVLAPLAADWVAREARE